MRLVAIAMLCLAVGCGTGVHAVTHPPRSVRESFADLQKAVRSEDPRAFCELIFPYGRDLPSSGLETELRALRAKKGRAGYQKLVDACVHETRRADVAGWKPLLGLSIVSVRTHGDMATARMRTKTGRVIPPAEFVDAAGGWRLLFRFA